MERTMTQPSDSKQPSKKHPVDSLPKNTAVSPKYVQEALRIDKGKNAKLISWKTKDFTSKGDNFVSIITSVIVQFSLGSEIDEVTYIVKIKQMTENGTVGDFDNMVFNKEGKFFSELLPLLNSELISINQEPLKMPRFLHHKWLEKQNQLFLSDLRARKFRLFCRKMGLDFQHAKLVMRELSRLHAISYVLQSKRPKRTLNKDFKFLDWEWFTYSEKLKTSFQVLVSGGLTTTALMAKEVGRDRVSEWFRDTSPIGVKLLSEQLVCNSPKFNVIGHGDCWINNILFKYDKRSTPTDVMLLDLQFCRQSSITADLSYFFFTSLERTQRKERLEELLALYYTSYKSILESARVPIPFSLEELREEFRKRNLFGLIMSSLLLPNILCDPEDIQEFDAAAEGCAGSYIEKKRKRSMRMLQKNVVFRRRMLDIFDDVAEIMNFA